MWAEENPFATRETHSQHKFSFNVWCGVFDNKLIGPHLFPHRLTGEVYLDFLQNILTVLLDDAGINVAGIYFQHDGASPHYRLIVRQFLNENFPNTWIGRGGSNQWPSRSPDFNPVDYHIWGYLKSKVYSTDINSREELLQRIEDACEEMRNNPDVIRKSVKNIKKGQENASNKMAVILSNFCSSRNNPGKLSFIFKKIVKSVKVEGQNLIVHNFLFLCFLISKII